MAIPTKARNERRERGDVERVEQWPLDRKLASAVQQKVQRWKTDEMVEN